ncbi:MAG: redox-regulated ATPase YchF [Candidatus Korarchaeota archaeon]|nr:redox-regulated ATPase YchF [Candidatus Korarchaeota archaeon]NIU82001.1 DUF933 domain-containing protein [Candidatus Thorarchaeota archaeon]NIW15169.1 DUF933 domain-containing protein [Candidatus Thorarchaeota archaeon]NIW53159.1 DUF933 domain-containing protein [Candidatus Korarchaeota archaeon]
MLIGLVGKPNSGKTTLFNALTSGRAKTADYPFTTIEPNIGVGYVTQKCACRDFNVDDDPRNSVCRKGVRYIPVKVIDVAGLVPDAWKGRGLGNEFLDDLRQADVLIHVVDGSGRYDADGKDLGSPGSWDPLKDIDFLEQEISRWMHQIIMREWDQIKRRLKSGRDKVTTLLETRLTGLSIKRETIENAITETELLQLKPENWTDQDLLRLTKKIREKAKPNLTMLNKMDIPKAAENFERIKVKEKVVPASALAELALIEGVERNTIEYTRGGRNFKILERDDLSNRKKKLYNKIRELMGEWGSTGVQECINTAVFDILDMIVVYPVRNVENLTDKEGRVLPDVHLVKKGTTAKEFAGKIHSDIKKTFLFAIDARKKRKISANYRLENRDVISIKTSSRS